MKKKRCYIRCIECKFKPICEGGEIRLAGQENFKTVEDVGCFDFEQYFKYHTPIQQKLF